MSEPGPRPPLEVAQALALATAATARAAILVEGWSDEAAVEAVARTCDAALARRGVLVLPIGGITNMGRFIEALGPGGFGLRLSGLYDASEERVVLRALDRAGLGSTPASPRAARALTRADAEDAGFFACERDLEDELIRAVGPEAVERLVASQDELASFRRFQRQPEHRDRDAHGQLKRFMGTRAGRKARYGALLAAALPGERIPAALRRVIAHATG